MKASFVDLRKKSGEIIKALRRNETVTVYYRGKPAAVMHPITEDPAGEPKVEDQPAFGMWADREDLADVDGYLRRLRKGRFSDL